MSSPSRSLLALTGLLLAAAAPAPAGAYSTADMNARLTAEMKRAGLKSGAVVRDLDTQTELFAVRPDALRIPASVEKLYTTATFLERLGPAGTLDTQALGTGPVGPDGAVQGDLILKGAGDPFFGAASAQRLVTALKAAGVQRVAGGVVGDETIFDKRRSTKSGRYDFEVGGVLSGLAFDRGIAGGLPQSDAALYAAQRFGSLLGSAGIRQGRRPRAGAAPEETIDLARVSSRPARVLIRDVNVPSNNFAAEMLAKNVGARYGTGGTTSAGMSVMGETLGEYSAAPTLVDGSGLSRSNLTSPRDVVDLLQGMHGSDLAVPFRTSLALMGRSGTVRRRARGTAAQSRCRVKTGTLRRVSALAGYCLSRNGRTFGFAILNFGISNTGAHRIQDRMAEAMARVDTGTLAAPAP